MPNSGSRAFALGQLAYYATLIAVPVAAFAFEARHHPGAWGMGPGVLVLVIGIAPAAFANLAVLALLRRRVDRVGGVNFVALQALLGAVCGAALYALLSLDGDWNLLGLFLVPAGLTAAAIFVARPHKAERLVNDDRATPSV